MKKKGKKNDLLQDAELITKSRSIETPRIDPLIAQYTIELNQPNQDDGHIERPTSIRMTKDDKLLAEEWLKELNKISKNRISIARLLRGFLYMKGKINYEVLYKAIKMNT